MTESPRPPDVVRLTAVGCLLTVLLAAQYAVFSAYWYHLHFPSGNGPVAVPNLLLVAAVCLLAGTVFVLWRGETGSLRTRPAVFLGTGLVLLLLSLRTVGHCDTGGATLGTDPHVYVGALRYGNFVFPELVLGIDGARCGASMRVTTAVVGYPLLAAGLWVETWTDEKLAAVVAAIDSHAPSGDQS